MSASAYELSLSRVRQAILARLREGKSLPSGFRFLENAYSVSGGVSLNTCVYAPARVLVSSILSTKVPLFPILGSKSSGTIYTGLKSSLFRLFMAENDSLGILCPIMWLDITLSCDKVGRGVGYSVDLWGSGIGFGETRWVLSMQYESSISSSDKEIPMPTF